MGKAKKTGVIRMYHMPMTEKECYENIKRLNKEFPSTFMDADEWLVRERRFKELRGCFSK